MMPTLATVSLGVIIDISMIDSRKSVNACYSPSSDEFNLDILTKGPLEARARFVVIVSFVDLVCKRNLLLVVFWQETDLFMAP